MTDVGKHGWRPAAAVMLVAVGLAPLVLLNPAGLAGDPPIYRERIIEMIETGGLPYLESTFEHLPPVAVPVGAAWVLGGWTGDLAYTAIFALLMLGCLVGTVRLLDKSGRELGLPLVPWRWMAMAAPLFPVALFRSDPFTILLAAAGLWAVIADAPRKLLWELIAVMAKGWGVVFAAYEWVAGRRGKAVVLTTALLVMLGALLALPGFREPRAFSGTHTDSVAGGTLALIRLLQGEPIGRFDAAGAIYLEAPVWSVLLNLDLGLAVGALALICWSGPFTIRKGIELMGVLVVAVLLASPLLSPQFLLWPTVFFAFHRSSRIRVTMVVTSLLTIVFMLAWDPMYAGNLWWVPVVFLRNAALVGLGVVGALMLGARPEMEERALPRSDHRHVPTPLRVAS